MNRKQRRSMKALGQEVVEQVSQEQSDKQKLQQEYYRLCAESGELQYKISIMEIDLDNVNSRLKEVNVKFAEMLAAEKAENEKA